MIHVDEVINLFEEHFPNCECDASADYVKVDITEGRLNVKVTFISKSQVFNFDNGKGKTFTFTNFEALKTNIDTFFYLENSFKPKAQAICSVFSNQILGGANTVIKRIRGGNAQEFTAVYSGVEDDIIIRVINTDLNIFEVSYLDKHYTYSMDEVGNIYPVPTIDNYSDELHKRYADSSFVQVARTGLDTFSLKYENGLVINITANLTEDFKIEISVDKVELNGTELQTDIGVVELENVCDLSELYTNFDYLLEESKDYTDELDSMVRAEFVKEVLETEEVQQDSNVTQEELVSQEEEFITQEEIASQEEEFITQEEIASQESDLEITEEDNSFIPDEDDFKLVLIQDTNEIASKVRFVFPDKYLDIDVSVAVSLGIPIEAIITKEKQIIKRGMLITDMELKHRIFARNISKDETLCSSVISKLFS